MDGHYYSIWRSNTTKKQYVFVKGQDTARTVAWLNAKKRASQAKKKDNQAKRIEPQVDQKPTGRPQTWNAIKARLFNDLI